MTHSIDEKAKINLRTASKKIMIGVAGTHSTGKSTFCNDLDAKLKLNGFRVGRVAETAREARGHGFPILKEQTFETTLWIITRGICKELEATIGNDIILADRPAIDALCYLNAALRFRSETLGELESEYLYNLVRCHMNIYDVLIKTIVDPSIPINMSRPRDNDYQFRTLVDEELSSTFAKLKCETIALVREDNNSVMNTVVSECISRRASIFEGADASN